MLRCVTYFYLRKWYCESAIFEAFVQDLIFKWSETVATRDTRAKSEGLPLLFVAFIGNIPFLKALRINSPPSERALTLSKVFVFSLLVESKRHLFIDSLQIFQLEILLGKSYIWILIYRKCPTTRMGLPRTCYCDVIKGDQWRLYISRTIYHIEFVDNLF